MIRAHILWKVVIQQSESLSTSFKTNMYMYMYVCSKLNSHHSTFSECNPIHALTLTYSVGMICFALLWCRITLYTVSGTKSNTRFKYTSSFCKIRNTMLLLASHKTLLYTSILGPTCTLSIFSLPFPPLLRHFLFFFSKHTIYAEARAQSKYASHT